MQGERGLVSLDYPDYQGLLGRGIMDEDVRLSLRKAVHGVEYAQGAPELIAKAGLYTIVIEGTNAKPQMDIDGPAAERARRCGFRDGDEVRVSIERLPTRNPREAAYDGLKLDLDL